MTDGFPLDPDDCPHDSTKLLEAAVEGYGSLTTYAILECQGCGGLGVQHRPKIRLGELD